MLCRCSASRLTVYSLTNVFPLGTPSTRIASKNSCFSVSFGSSGGSESDAIEKTTTNTSYWRSTSRTSVAPQPSLASSVYGARTSALFQFSNILTCFASDNRVCVLQCLTSNLNPQQKSHAASKPFIPVHLSNSLVTGNRIYWAHMQTSVTTPLRHVRAQCNSPGIPITLCIICAMSMSQQAYQAPHMQNLDNEYSTLQKRRSMSLRSHAIRALVIHNHDYVRSTVGYLSSSLWGHGRFSVNHNQTATIGCHYRNTNPQLRCHLFDV